MKLLREPGETHPFFDDVALKVSTHWSLSTSQLSSDRFTGYGWGQVRVRPLAAPRKPHADVPPRVCQVVPDGFGIAYMVNDNALNFNVACLRSWARAGDLAAALERALADMRTLCEGAHAAKL
jgi:carnitine O-acetyltransferase